MAVSEDRILDGKVRLRQAREGYRAGMDAALLAAACEAGEGETVLDAGCGVGAALLAAAARNPGTRFVGVERDPEALALAQENVDLNGLRGRVGVMGGDIARPFADLGLELFDAVIANPPFFDDQGALRGPGPRKRASFLNEAGLAAWIAFLVMAVRDGGAITLIHRAERLADILAELAPKTGTLQVRPVHPFADAPAKRVIVRALKSGRAPMRLLPPLVLHDRSGGKHTAAAESVLRGQARLEWL